MEFMGASKVEYLEHLGDDITIVAAAKVIKREEALKLPAEKIDGLIRFLIEKRHGSPFEQGCIRFEIDCPIAMLREFERHRIGFAFTEEISLNVESGRYSELRDKFYLPASHRPMIPAPDHKFSAPHYVPFDDLKQHEGVTLAMSKAYGAAYETYQQFLSLGVAREVARFILPVGMFSKFVVQCNPRAMMHFLSLRVNHPGAIYPTFPQLEMQWIAEAMETIFAEHWPITHKYFNEKGRVAP